MGIRMRRKKLGMFQIRFKAIDRALLAGMLLLIVATMVAFHGYTENAEQSQINFVQLVMEKNAINQAEQFETFVDEKIAILKALAAYPEIYKMDKSQQSAFIKNRSAKWGFRHIFVMDT